METLSERVSVVCGKLFSLAVGFLLLAVELAFLHAVLLVAQTQFPIASTKLQLYRQTQNYYLRKFALKELFLENYEFHEQFLQKCFTRNSFKSLSGNFDEREIPLKFRKGILRELFL